MYGFEGFVQEKVRRVQMKNFYQWYRKHITGASMLFFLATTVIASFVGLVIPRMIHLGKLPSKVCQGMFYTTGIMTFLSRYGILYSRKKNRSQMKRIRRPGKEKT
jgi:hypothetical protein